MFNSTFAAPDAGLRKECLKAGEVFQARKLGKCRRRCQEYKDWQHSLSEAKQLQPDCKTKFACTLEGILERRLGHKVRFYTAVYSSFDIFHGVDAFVEIVGVVVTIDVTLNPRKVRGKAHVVYHDGDGIVDLADRIENVYRVKEKIAA